VPPSAARVRRSVDTVSRARPAVDVRRDWGSEEEGASILHVDMDAFFASVELARRPHLRGRPVIVGGKERSVVLAATYEARAFGVHSAMPMARAMRMCPQAVVIPPDHRAYREVSTSVMEILGEVTPLVEQISVDEAFLDVSGARRRLGLPTSIGAHLRERVRATHGITCSVGVAANKFVAKLASTYAKPDGLLLIPSAATVPFLRTLPVELLWGVGAQTQAALARWGLRTVAELADADVTTVQRAVGSVAGKHLHDLAWGRDPRPVRPGRVEKSIGAESTFGRDQFDLGVVQDRMRSLTDECGSRLRRQRLVARTVSIKVRTSDFRTLTRSRTLTAPTDVGRELFLVSRELLAGVDLRGLPVRLVGVRAEGLSSADSTPVQPTFDELGLAAEASGSGQEVLAATREALHAAELAMDGVRERFGRTAIGPGMPVARRGVVPTTHRASGHLS